MPSWSKLAVLVLAFAAALSAQPKINGLVNGASYAVAPLDSSANPIGNNNIAQGVIFIVFGTGMGPATLVAPSGLPLPTSFPDVNGTSVTVSSGGQTLKAFIVYTSAGQVAGILPSNTPIGAANATVTFNGQTSAQFKINVVKSALGVFTRNSQGSGPGIAQIFRSATDVSLNSLTNPAQGGNTLVIYGTGLGAIPGADNDKPGAVPVGSNVTINIAGVTTPAAYAGRSPDFPGLDQINFVLPANVPAGCYIPAEITASAVPSNLFYLSIGSGSACTHPLGLNQAALAKLDSGGTVNIGVFQLLRAVVSGVPAEGAGGLFDKVDANGAFQIFNRIPNAFGAVNFPVVSGSCVVLDTLDTGSGFSVPDFSLIGGAELKAGASVNVAGSNGNSQGVLAISTGGYLGVFFATLGPGTWTLSGSGGPDVGAFSAKTDLPENLVWSNAGNFANVPRGDITISWTGGNTAANPLVTIFGTNVVINPTDPSKSRGKEFFCNAPASAGRFVVPGTIISQLPSSTVDTAAGEVAVGTLGINTGGGANFSAPLTSGGTTDSGILSYGEAHTISVKYQ
jgi:uncharacterized protein (TIGR03437 family)